MDYTVLGILQAGILEWVAFPFSRGSSQPRNQTGVSCTAGRFFTNWAIMEALICSLSEHSTFIYPSIDVLFASNKEVCNVLQDILYQNEELLFSPIHLRIFFNYKWFINFILYIYVSPIFAFFNYVNFFIITKITSSLVKYKYHWWSFSVSYSKNS